MLKLYATVWALTPHLTPCALRSSSHITWHQNWFDQQILCQIPTFDFCFRLFLSSLSVWALSPISGWDSHVISICICFPNGNSGQRASSRLLQ